jgi:hypothetical protein
MERVNINDFYNDLSENGKEYCDRMHDLFNDYKHAVDEEEMEVILYFFQDWNRHKDSDLLRENYSEHFKTLHKVFTLHHLTSEEIRIVGVVTGVESYEECIDILADCAKGLGNSFNEKGLESFKIYEGYHGLGKLNSVPKFVVEDIKNAMKIK